MQLPSYELRLFDRTLLTFGMGRPQKRLVVEGTAMAKGVRNLLPWGLEPTDDSVCHWLKRRSLPINRCNASKACAAMGIKFGDVEAVYKVGMGLSLNDAYWVVPKGFEGRWDECNLFANAFPEAVGLASLTGSADEGADPIQTPSPELTTSGSVNKGWRIGEDGARVLCKGSSAGFAADEWLGEVMASQLADIMGLEHVGYTHAIWGGVDCSACTCMTDENTGLVPFSIAVGRASFDNALKAANLLGGEAVEQLADMLVFDALIGNIDRHFGNIGLLYDARTRRIQKLAPMYDHGRALFPNFESDLLQDIEGLLAGCRPAFGAQSFDELAARVMGPRQLEALARLESFSGFTGIPAGCEGRAQVIEEFVNRRFRSLMKIAPVSRDALA